MLLRGDVVPLDLQRRLQVLEAGLELPQVQVTDPQVVVQVRHQQVPRRAKGRHADAERLAEGNDGVPVLPRLQQQEADADKRDRHIWVVPAEAVARGAGRRLELPQCQRPQVPLLLRVREALANHLRALCVERSQVVVARRDRGVVRVRLAVQILQQDQDARETVQRHVVLAVIDVLQRQCIEGMDVAVHNDGVGILINLRG